MPVLTRENGVGGRCELRKSHPDLDWSTDGQGVACAAMNTDTHAHTHRRTHARLPPTVSAEHSWALVKRPRVEFPLLLCARTSQSHVVFSMHKIFSFMTEYYHVR